MVCSAITAFIRSGGWRRANFVNEPKWALLAHALHILMTCSAGPPNGIIELLATGMEELAYV
jgi:hypothetical protein